MNFIKGVPDILVNDTFEIKSVRYFNEDEDTITLEIAEYVPQFVKGYVCDMNFSFPLINSDGKSADTSYCSHANDLVLVYIRKTVGMDSVSNFEYVFYK